MLPRGYKPLNVHQSGATFTGIDGVSEKGVGMTEVPLAVIGAPNLTWNTDLLGGVGSSCPALLGNDSLMYYKASIFENILPGGVGALVLLVESEETNACTQSFFLRILLTDSGHYLLPADAPLSEQSPAKVRQEQR